MHLQEISKCKIAQNVYNMKKYIKNPKYYTFYFFNYILTNMNLHKNLQYNDNISGNV